CRTSANSRAAVSFFAGKRVPQPATSTRRATSNWSRPNGTTHTGTPRARAFWVAPIPPWVTAHTARSNTGPCGTNSHTVAFGPGVTSLGSPAGSVATTCTGSSASAVIVVATSFASACFCDDVVTRTIGRSIAVSQSGTVSMAGSNMHGPIIWTASPQSVCGYSNGFPLATSISGARRMNSSADATGGAPALARMLLPWGRTALSTIPLTAGRSAGARIRPSMPGNGARPSPKGGTPCDCRGGVYGEKHAHGMSPASATDWAPQQLTSTINASGRVRVTASVKSATSYAARRQNT